MEVEQRGAREENHPCPSGRSGIWQDFSSFLGKATGTCSLAETFYPSPDVLPTAERITVLVAGAGPAPDTVAYPALSQGNSPCGIITRLLQRKSQNL